MMPRKKINISKETLEDLYINQKLSTREIAKKIEVCQTTIRNHMKEFGIKSRSMSEAALGRTVSEETKKKIGKAFYGKPLSEEHKIKISEACKDKEFSEETRRKISEANLGRHYSEETKRKMSESHWKGGAKVSYAKHRAKRRQLGFKPLNKPFEGSEGHHLQDKETVIFIPRELHQRICHNNWSGQNMNTIDKLALDYLELQILGEVKDGRPRVT